MIDLAAIGGPGTAAELLRAGAGDIIEGWRAACTPEALGQGAGAREESDGVTADRARALVTATGPSVVSALATVLDPGGQDPSAASPMTRLADALADHGFGVGPLVRHLSLLRQILHAEAHRRLPTSAVAETEHQLDVALDAVMEACASRAAERLEQDALVDPLTGLLNRRALERDLSREMAAAERHGRPLSVLTADLNGLKKVNDQQGHTVGDQALQAVADALGSALRESDSAYRVGGDEFVVLLPDMGPEAISSFVGRVRAAGPPSFSWGAATFPDEVTSRPCLLDLADRRLIGYRQAEGLGRPVATDDGARAGSVAFLSGTPARRSRRSMVIAAFLGGVLLGGGSLASAATGTLPGPMQEVAHSILAKVGIPVPTPNQEDPSPAGTEAAPVSRFEDDAAGQPCTYTDGREFTGSHGQYVSAHPDDTSTPQNERELAAQSRCGRPTASAGPGAPESSGRSGEAGRPEDVGPRQEPVAPGGPGQDGTVGKPDAGTSTGRPTGTNDPAGHERARGTTIASTTTSTTTTTTTTTTTAPPPATAPAPPAPGPGRSRAPDDPRGEKAAEGTAGTGTDRGPDAAAPVVR